MTADEGERRRWRLMWLSSIQAFGDSETQKTRWIDPAERNPAYSYVECMCSYFDDALIGDADAYKKRLAAGMLTVDEVEAVAEFHAVAESHISPGGDDWDTSAILKDAKWQMVVDAARRAQERLLPLLTNSTERDALTRPLVWNERDGVYSAGLIGSRVVPAGKWVSGKTVSWVRQMVDSLRRTVFGSPNN